jgi:DNA repair protein RadC
MDLSLPGQRITITFARADLPKDGPHYDLPVALVILASMQVIEADHLSGWITVGELARDGGSSPLPAFSIAARHARQTGRGLICPAAQEAVLGSWQTLIDHLAIDMAHLTRQRVRVLYLDGKNRLVKDEHISEGTIDEASVHPREVIHHALDAGASALILVHNHPSGPEPSRADIQLTHRIAEAGRLVGITVHDHVIVGREGHVSLRAKGLI